MVQRKRNLKSGTSRIAIFASRKLDTAAAPGQSGVLQVLVTELPMLPLPGHCACVLLQGLLTVWGLLPTLRPSHLNTAQGPYSLQNNQSSDEEKYLQMSNKISQGSSPGAIEDECILIPALVLAK